MRIFDAEVNGANGTDGVVDMALLRFAPGVIMKTFDAEVNGANGTDGAADKALPTFPSVPADIVVIMETFDADVNGANGTNGTDGAVDMALLPFPPVPADVVIMETLDEEVNGANGTDGAIDMALLPFPPVPADVVPFCVEGDFELIPRRGLASKGHKVQLLTNHYKVNVTNVDGHFFHYSVALYEDGRPVDGKGIGRKLLDLVLHKAELEGKDFAYDGKKSLFTVGALPRNKLEFTIVLEDISNMSTGNSIRADWRPNENERKRLRTYQSKTYKVEISYAAKIPMQAIAQALHGQDSEKSQEALRVLHIILRQHAAKQGCLLERQSFFHDDVNNISNVRGCIHGCRGFHSSFCTTQGGLSLNIDVSTSTTMIIQPGPVVNFLIASQNAKDPLSLDWAKAKQVLKNLRVNNSSTNTEYKITGLSDKICKELMFSMKRSGERDENGEPLTTELSVYDYYVRIRKIPLHYSGDLPCINVGKPKRPTYIPLELCSLVSLQRYTKALTTLPRLPSGEIEKSRLKPQDRMKTLTKAQKINNYADEPLMRACGVSVSSNFTQVEGRILEAPTVRVGNGVDLFPRYGRWNFNNKKLVEPTTIAKWAVVSFSACCNIKSLISDFIKCGKSKGIKISGPSTVLKESPQDAHGPPLVRVNKMFELMKRKLSGAPDFLLCLLPERKNSLLYGPWKRMNLCDNETVTQCIAPMTERVNDQYLTNVLLKINAKLGGLNSKLSIENFLSIPLVSKVPTLILGMYVCHGSPGQSDVPSIAAVVGSRQWPLISKYRASVRTQSSKVEMIDSLFKKVSDNEDDGIMRELLTEFCSSSRGRKPEQIIIFRNGVSESQFNQVLNVELNQIIEACKFKDEEWRPKFVVIIAQKNHHMKFFLPASPDNVAPGTVIDNTICHPRNNDFYLCAQAGMIGATKPTHYHVLLDEVGFTPDDLQEFVHSLSYVYQRGTTSISVVAPVRYAHLAATQMRQFMKFDTCQKHYKAMMVG